MALRKRNPDEPAKPKKTRWYKQIWMVYQMTRRIKPAVTWWMLGGFVLTTAVFVVVGGAVLRSSYIYWSVLGVSFGILAALFILVRIATAAQYQEIDGKPGAARSAMGQVRRGWDFEDQPVAVDARTQDMVFRGIGMPGVLLVSEGPPQRAQRMLEAEKKKIVRILPNVPVVLLQSGNMEGQIPLRKLPRKIAGLPRKLTKYEVAEVTKRLHALGGFKLPVPKGVDLTKARPDRKAMKGR